MNSSIEIKTLIFETPVIFSPLKYLLKEKCLNEYIFEKINHAVSFYSDIKDHTAWAYKHIYSIPYPAHDPQADIARFYHGIQHVSRAAMYVPVLANLYRKYGDPEALELTNENIKLIQIAVLFHDAARAGEEKDLWDHESATFLYWYLTLILNLPHYLAKKISEAAANKDWSPGKEYYVLHEIQGEIHWFIDLNRVKAKDIYHKLIHDADCLDIIRARDAFDARYLDFYKEFVGSQSNPALEDMAELIVQARSLIERQGDGRRRTKPDIKKRYENEMAYTEMMRDITHENYSFLKTLYANGQILSNEQLAASSIIFQNNILYQERIFARGMIVPSAIARKSSNKRKNHPVPDEETLAQIEYRKVKRRKGVLTSTSKGDGLTKEGNPKRSVSLLRHGGGVFADVGCLIFNPDLDAISGIYPIDMDTGWGKKDKLFSGSTDTHYRETFFNPSSSESRSPDQHSSLSLSLDELERNLKLGGSARLFKRSKHPATHTEILYHVKDYDAIYYTLDPTSANEFFHRRPENKSPHAPVLKAIFLQYEYSYAFNGKILPIYEYSGIHNYLKKILPFSDEQIIKMWVDLCSSFIKDAIQRGEICYIKNASIKTILTWNLYRKCPANAHFETVKSPISNYPEYLQLAIKEAVKREKEQCILDEEDRITRTVLSIGAAACVEKRAYLCILSSNKLLTQLRSLIETNLIDSIQSLSTFYFTYKKCEELIRYCQIAKKAGIDTRFAVKAIIELLNNNLPAINDENSHHFKEQIYNFIRLGCYAAKLNEFKPQLSKLSCVRWISVTYKLNAGLPNEINFNDLQNILYSLCKQNDEKINLNTLTVLEISDGPRNTFLFLNVIPELNRPLKGFFLPETNGTSIHLKSDKQHKAGNYNTLFSSSALSKKHMSEAQETSIVNQCVKMGP